jgi:hypothetical protein
MCKMSFRCEQGIPSWPNALNRNKEQCSLKFLLLLLLLIWCGATLGNLVQLRGCLHSPGTIAINPSGATKNFFDNTKDPVSADAGSRRVYVPDTISGAF